MDLLYLGSPPFKHNGVRGKGFEGFFHHHVGVKSPLEADSR